MQAWKMAHLFAGLSEGCWSIRDRGVGFKKPKYDHKRALLRQLI